MVCEGGVSVFYSHSLKLLFFSYQNGITYYNLTHNVTELVSILQYISL